MESEATNESSSTELDESQSMNVDGLYLSAVDLITNWSEKQGNSASETSYFSAEFFENSLKAFENEVDASNVPGLLGATFNSNELVDPFQAKEVEIIEEEACKKDSYLNYFRPRSDGYGEIGMDSVTQSDVIEFSHSESKMDFSSPFESKLFPVRYDLFSSLQDVEDPLLKSAKKTAPVVSDDDEHDEDLMNSTEAPEQTLKASVMEKSDDIDWKFLTQNLETEMTENEELENDEKSVSDGNCAIDDSNDIAGSHNDLFQNDCNVFAVSYPLKVQRFVVESQETEITNSNNTIVTDQGDSHAFSIDDADEEVFDNESDMMELRIAEMMKNIEESYDIPKLSPQVADCEELVIHPIGGSWGKSMDDDNKSKTDLVAKVLNSAYVQVKTDSNPTSMTSVISEEVSRQDIVGRKMPVQPLEKVFDPSVKFDVQAITTPDEYHDSFPVRNRSDMNNDKIQFPVNSPITQNEEHENEALLESSDMDFRIEEMLLNIGKSFDQANYSDRKENNTAMMDNEDTFSTQIDCDNKSQSGSDLGRIDNTLPRADTSVFDYAMHNITEVKHPEDDNFDYEGTTNDILPNFDNIERLRPSTFLVTSNIEDDIDDEEQDSDDIEMSLKINNMLKSIELSRSAHNDDEKAIADCHDESNDGSNSESTMSHHIDKMLQKIGDTRLQPSFPSSGMSDTGCDSTYVVDKMDNDPEIPSSDRFRNIRNNDDDDSSSTTSSDESLELDELDDQVAPLKPKDHHSSKRDPTTSLSSFESARDFQDSDTTGFQSSLNASFYYSPMKDREQRKLRASFSKLPRLNSQKDTEKESNDSESNLHASVYFSPMKDQEQKKGNFKGRSMPTFSSLDGEDDDKHITFEIDEDESGTDSDSGCSSSSERNNASSATSNNDSSHNDADETIRRRSLRLSQALRRTSDLENFVSVASLSTSKHKKYAGLAETKNFESCMLNLDDDTEADELTADDIAPPPLEESQGFSGFRPIGYFLSSFGFKAKLPVLTEEEDFFAKVSSYRMNDLLRLKILGEGQFGQVWLVSDKSRNAFALKLFAKYDLIEEGEIDMILDEAKMQQKIHNNPFIVKLYSIFQDAQIIYMLMQFAQGGELFSVIQKYSEENASADVIGMPETQAKFYTVCIADAIAHMHSLQVAYRDLKPENCMIDSHGYPMLIDFGYAKYVPEKTYTFCGTPRFLPPEAINLSSGYDLTADHWSLGILIYEMLAGGVNPFFEEGMSELALFTAIEEEDYLPLSKLPLSNPSLSSAALNILDGLLTKDPSLRLGSLGTTGILQHEWFLGLNLPDLRKRTVKAPWIPQAKDALDAACFDEWDHLTDKVKKKYPRLTRIQEERFKSLPY